MTAQRKIFRIEQTLRALGRDDEDARASTTNPVQAQILAEIRALRTLLDAHRPPAGDLPSPEMRKLKIELDVIGEAIKQTRCEIVALQNEGFDSARIARVGKELDAVLGDTSGATDTILQAAEAIDESASALHAILKNANEKGLAQDIQECVTAIFEACNFHDLTGQRISKIAVTLKMVEEHLARMMEIWSVIDRFNIEAAQTAVDHGLLNGPKLAGENGHSTQDDIDRLFS